MKRIFLFLVVITFLSSCTIKEVEIGKIEGVSIKDINKEHVSLELMVPVKNNNNFAFTISDVNLELTLSNVSLGKVKKSKKLKIPANSNAIQTMEFDIKFSKLAESPLTLLTSIIKNKVDLKASGYIKVRKCLIWKKFNINENQSVKLFRKGLF
ncbi:MAG: LEA type 2 family protein [Bacteroidia bacterium]|nr:LEA type 2 family protein [Bacteroidia bacterium]